VRDWQYPAIAALGYGCAFLDEMRNSIDYENRQVYNKSQQTGQRSKVTGY